jgi:hypothetical protein
MRSCATPIRLACADTTDWSCFEPAPRGYLYARLNGAAFHPVDLRQEESTSLADWLMQENIPGRALRLRHGEVQDRRYGASERGLQRFAFDPFVDIALDHDGCWRWSSDKRELHAFVRRYFELRHEDGV